MNYIAIRIESKQVSASLQSNRNPGIQEEISRARLMIYEQIVRGERGSDAWATADYALATLLTASINIPNGDIKELYEGFASIAETYNIESARRILRAIRIPLKEMGDPSTIPSFRLSE
jgi:hypothetical protein